MSWSDVPDDLDDPRRQQLLLNVAQRAARTETRDEHLALEAANHAVAELCRQPGSKRPDPKAWANWVRTAAKRHARDADQRAARHLPMGHHGSGLDGEGGRGGLEVLLERLQPVGSLGSHAAGRADLQACLTRLSKLDADLVVGKYIDGLPSKELGARHGLSPGAVDKRISAAKGKLRDCLGGDASSKG